MSKRCKKKTLDGSTLSIQMVEKCNAVCVTGIDKTITVDTVDNFFCNKRRSGGGEVETVDYKPQDGYCIVYYVNPSGMLSFFMQITKKCELFENNIFGYSLDHNWCSSPPPFTVTMAKTLKTKN